MGLFGPFCKHYIEIGGKNEKSVWMSQCSFFINCAIFATKSFSNFLTKDPGTLIRGMDTIHCRLKGTITTGQQELKSTSIKTN